MQPNERALFQHYAGHALANIARENRGDPNLAGLFDGLFGGGSKQPAQYESKPYLSKGSSGPDVKLVQAKLGRPQTGQFDFDLEQAVKAYQVSLGVPSSGTVDARTWAGILGEKFKDPAASAASTLNTVSTVGSQVGGLLGQFFQKPGNTDQLMADPGTTTVAPAAPMSTLTYVAIGGSVLALVGVGGFVLYRMTR
jgi:hypothetical protein